MDTAVERVERDRKEEVTHMDTDTAAVRAAREAK